VQQYVRCALMKAGEAFSDAADHEAAAACFRTFMEVYAGKERPGKRGRESSADGHDEMASIARYALGREYIYLKSYGKLIETYRPCVNGLRGDRFRVSALRMLGYHAAQGGQQEAAIEAYATLLDEYGENVTDAKGNVRPVPQSDRLRPQSGGWDGVRMPAGEMDLGEARFALGLLYWRAEDYARCAKTLSPFLADAKLTKNRYRDRALYMAGKSYYQLFDFEKGLKLIQAVLQDHPKFDAVEEAYANAARGCLETKNWRELDRLYSMFARQWPTSGYKLRMDLYSALSQLNQGKRDTAMSSLKSITESGASQDVRADAWYHLALCELDAKKAAEMLDKSVAILPKESSCLAAARAHFKLNEVDKTKELLERVLHDFPKGNPSVLADAEADLKKLRSTGTKGRP
jgi:tetratricopeptide (TPR) repeat protein